MEGGRLGYFCQGCDMLHSVAIGEGAGPRWGYNGNPEKPTFTPSVRVSWDQMSAAGRERNRQHYLEHGRYMTNEELAYDEHKVCHTFVRDGMVQFLPDCTHVLAGQTVPLPELPAEWRDE